MSTNVAINQKIKGHLVEVSLFQWINTNSVVTLAYRVGIFFFESAKRTYGFGQDVRVFVDCIAQQSATIEELKIQNSEIDELKKKILALEEEATKFETVKTQLSETHCRMVLLEKGRRFTQQRTF
jgi:hypothetical protein